MHKNHVLHQIVRKQKAKIPQGIYSVCSANEFVIEAALEYGGRKNMPVLLEATSNQVNQFGGYTGMNPHDFKKYVFAIATKVGFPVGSIILGGDHLGPNPWKGENSKSALTKACKMVEDYVLAGFTKIHLDASMHLGDDEGPGNKALDPEIVADRTALLCVAAEEAYQRLLETETLAAPPIYIIGSEVPAPGGTQEDLNELSVTKPEDLHQTIMLTRQAFSKNGLLDAWSRVVGVVVQPGVDFSDQKIHEYDSTRAQLLVRQLDQYPNLVFEGHSTDYQQPHNLKKMVEDGVAILKVGPELTFAFREALFSLHYMEEELFPNPEIKKSNLLSVVDGVMLGEPGNWHPYYKGSEEQLQFSRKYSLSDRIRYYWPHPKVTEAIATLFANLNSVDIPLTLLSQCFPVQYEKVRMGVLDNSPEALLKDRIARIFDKYYFATQPQKEQLD